MASIVSEKNNNIKISFECPISNEIMEDPVICSDGHTYDRKNIYNWLITLNKNTSPITGLRLENKNLTPNHTLKSMIEEFKGNKNKKVNLKGSVEKELNKIKNEKELEESKKFITGIKPKDFIFIIDVSGSMGKTEEVERGQYLSILQIVRHACKVGIQLCTENDRLAIITFSTNSEIKMELKNMTSGNKELASNCIDNIKPLQTTNLYAGLHSGLSLLKNRSDKSNLGALFVFTDGLPNINPPRGEEGMIDLWLRDNNDFKAIVNTYGFGYELDSKMLFNISRKFNSSFSFIPSFDIIGTVFVNTISKILLMNESDLIIKKEQISDEVRVVVYETIYNVVNNLNKYYYKYDGTLLQSNYIDKTNLKKSLEENSKIIKTLIQNIEQSDDIKNDYTKALVEDLKGQVLEALSNCEYYTKWGRHYLYSLGMAHELKICNNFKDPGVQFYSDEAFNKLSELGGEIFLKLPPPKPKNSFNSHYRGMSRSNNTSNTRSFDMTQSYNRGGGCILEGSKVKTKVGNNIINKNIEDLKKDDIIYCDDKEVKIICKTKQLCKEIEFCVINNLKITPWHPIKINNEWIFPNNYTNKRITINEPQYMYNLYVGSNNHVMIEDISCASLGHNLKDNKVIEHEYLGTEKVINDLKSMNGWNKGLISLDNKFFSRDIKTNKINNIKKIK
jgi:Mg-chelatase subunit ChlD